MSSLAKRFPGRTAVAAVRVAAEPLENGASAANEVRIARRVMARRDIGKLVFLDIGRRCRRKSALRAVTFSGYVEAIVSERGRAEPTLAASPG